MFLDFYGLKEQPFGVTPDPRFLFLSPSHREALASLYCAIESDRGFSALVAPPGMGKTSLLFRMLESVKGKARTAFLFHPDINAPQFMQSLLLDIGLDNNGDNFVLMRDALNRLLLEERRAGRRFVLVLDEAQNLSPEVLESIRLLSNFETPREKLMHIVLAGQPQLALTLERPEMRQLSQRVSTLIRLHTFSSEETREYICHRLKIAGRSDHKLFNDQAVETISNASGGIPRNINSLCYQALSIGCALRKKQIGSKVLQELLADVRRHSLGEPESARTTAETQPSWQVPALHEMPPVNTWRIERPSNFWKWTTAVSVAVVICGALWTTALPKWKLIRESQNEMPDAARTAVVATQQTRQSPAQQVVSTGPASNSEPETKTVANENGSIHSEEPEARRDDNLTAAPSTKNIKSRWSNEPRVTRPQPTVPRVVVTERPETLFQVALDNYGESNSMIVDTILRQNPKLHDRYTIVAEGQRIFLPGIPESRSKDSSRNARSAVRRN